MLSTTTLPRNCSSEAALPSIVSKVIGGIGLGAPTWTSAAVAASGQATTARASQLIGRIGNSNRRNEGI